jgi:hypothetical protein
VYEHNGVSREGRKTERPRLSWKGVRQSESLVKGETFFAFLNGWKKSRVIHLTLFSL